MFNFIRSYSLDPCLKWLQGFGLEGELRKKINGLTKLDFPLDFISLNLNVKICYNKRCPYTPSDFIKF